MTLKTYQWIKGENSGQIRKTDGSTIRDGNMEFLVFTDGSRCNTTLINDYVVEIASDNPDDFVMINDIAPQPLTKFQQQVVTSQIPTHNVVEILKTVHEKPALSPLESILHAAKKVTKKVTISIEVEVPPANLIKIVEESFENGRDQVLEYLKKGWTEKEQQAVQAQVAEFIMDSIFKQQKKLTGLNETI